MTASLMGVTLIPVVNLGSIAIEMELLTHATSRMAPLIVTPTGCPTSVIPTVTMTGFPMDVKRTVTPTACPMSVIPTMTMMALRMSVMLIHAELSEKTVTEMGFMTSATRIVTPTVFRTPATWTTITTGSSMIVMPTHAE